MGASPDVPRCPRKLSKKAMKPLFQSSDTRKYSQPFRTRKKTQISFPRASVAWSRHRLIWPPWYDITHGITSLFEWRNNSIHHACDVMIVHTLDIVPWSITYIRWTNQISREICCLVSRVERSLIARGYVRFARGISLVLRAKLGILKSSG